jgi:SAM-dependent methyltransferase
LQYYILVEDLHGHVLDPSIPLNKPGLAIGDLCCGIGAWTLQVSRRTSVDTKFIALDMNLSQQPAQECLPEKVTIRSFNIFRPPAQDLIQAFDIVNIQIVFSFIDDSSIRVVLANILQRLKPGGYLQFSEMLTGLPVDAHSPDSSYKPQYVTKISPGIVTPTWPGSLGQHLCDAGFEDVKEIRLHRVLSTFRSWT